MGILEITDIIGIAAFALSGFWVAIEEELDLLGIFISSFLTALGGGIIRDVIVQKIPYSFIDFIPSVIVISIIFMALFLKLKDKTDIQRKTIFIVSDSIGLVSFSITGALVAIEANLNYFGVVLLSLITAIGGGVLRDILLNRVPMILKRGFYGSVAIAASTLIYLLALSGLLNYYTIIFIFLLSFALRLFAYYKNWHLPKL